MDSENNTCFEYEYEYYDYNNSGLIFNNSDNTLPMLTDGDTIASEIISIVCYDEWANDLWCDYNCNNSLCGYDNDMCLASGCDSDESKCYTAYFYFSFATQNGNEYIEYELLCDNFNAVKAVLAVEETNCTKWFVTNDANSNGYVGFHESIAALATFWGLDLSVQYEEKIK